LTIPTSDWSLVTPLRAQIAFGDRQQLTYRPGRGALHAVARGREPWTYLRERRENNIPG